MLLSVTILLLLQLAGETLARGLGLPIPGPVIGLAGFFALLVARPGLVERMRPTAQTLLTHLSLLFVPAGVGVVSHLATFGADGPALIAAVIISTILSILAGVATFLVVARLSGARDV